ncbi:VOC family protein [Aquabacterium sp.]|uniref:VOC family protein n=1 Tax=Aquabacterium sp. TaxID=1872578 RepID=UPI002CDE2E2B|nr:VOC family protein [Aquabacterium sp.]HSW06617.1 VOC family protein [Aquabacterium sp.]
MLVQAYLFFNGRCEEAVAFYKQALGAEVLMLMRNEDSPEPSPPGMLPPDSGKKVLHAAFKIGETTVLASDGMNTGQTQFNGFSLSISVNDKVTADRFFAALAEGGKVDLPLTKTFFSPWFGMLTDRFGVGWMIGLPGQP